MRRAGGYLKRQRRRLKHVDTLHVGRRRDISLRGVVETWTQLMLLLLPLQRPGTMNHS